MKTQVMVSWVLMPCSDMVGYHNFEDHAAFIFRAKNMDRGRKFLQNVCSLPQHYMASEPEDHYFNSKLHVI